MILLTDVISQSSNFCVIVLDETTYYISAFAVDSNGTIIDVQGKQITTEFNWKPGINTVMYFPFISDQSDKVGSCSLPVSGTKQSLGYRFSAGTGAQLNYSNVPSNMCFVSFFIKVHALKTNSSYPHAQTPNTALGNINYSFAHSSGSEYLKKFGIVTSYSGGSATWLAWGNTYNRSYEQRIHFAYGCDGTKAIAYINGVKYGEVTTTSARPGSAGFIRNVDADYSELIGEKAMRSESDIVKYFNKMKSKYGIS